MADNSKIEWTEATWNPIVGCDKVSPGCKNCYAIRDSHRMAGNPNEKIAKVYRGLTEIKNGAPNWTGLVRFVPERLDQPLRWKRPRMIFVNSQSDLFHEDIPEQTIADIFFTMTCAKQHIYQILTKRPKRMLEFIQNYSDLKESFGVEIDFKRAFKHVWFGVSCENQETADERIPFLLQTPAAIRWISAEPLLGKITFGGFDGNIYRAWLDKNAWPKTIDWVVVGGESGPNARPMHPDWTRSLRDQCVMNGVSFFFKQWGEYAPHGMRLQRIGKKAAGRLLDGREWNEMPKLKP